MRGMFSGKCTAVNFFLGGICLLKITERMRGNFLGEISQGNVWDCLGRTCLGIMLLSWKGLTFHCPEENCAG